MESNEHQYQIVGVNRASLKDVCFTVEARTQENARAKAELQNVVPTSITPASEDAVEESDAAAESSSSSKSDEQTDRESESRESGDDLDARWPWQRMAKYCYNWWALSFFWLILGSIFAVGSFNIAYRAVYQHTDDAGDVVRAALVNSLVCAVTAIFMIPTVRQLVRNPPRAVHWLRDLLIVESLIYLFIVSFPLAVGWKTFETHMNLAGVLRTAVFVLSSLALPGGLTVLMAWLIRPLGNRRFAHFGQVIQQLHQHGVPNRFFVDRQRGDPALKPDFDPNQAYTVQPQEPRQRIARGILLRRIATGSIVLPARVQWAEEQDEDSAATQA